MKFAHSLLAVAAVAAATLVVAPASAGWPGHDGGSSSSSSSSSSGGGDPTSVPEPADAVLLLMGVAGVVIGRKLHARAQRKG